MRVQYVLRMIVKSQDFRRVPTSYWPILAIALTNVSWTRSSASDGCRCNVRAKARNAGMRSMINCLVSP